jgi:hypothetical protein
MMPFTLKPQLKSLPLQQPLMSSLEFYMPQSGEVRCSAAAAQRTEKRDAISQSPACKYHLNLFQLPENMSTLNQYELNPGFVNQKLVLKWVQKKVTLFGKAAGAMSVNSHLVNGDFENPSFRPAISQSGGSTYSLQ